MRRVATTGNQRRAVFLALLGLAAATLLAVGAVVASSQAMPGEQAPSSVPLAVDKSLGINADLSQLNTGEREEALAAMEAAGFGWLRHRFPWDVIEKEQGAYDWAVWDEIVSGAIRHNIRLIAVLDGSPPWARAGEDNANPLAPPSEDRYFGDWAAAFAQRYGARIDRYQVWDEPNIAPHWGAREVDPVAYARLLREAAIRIRAADPGAVILAAALAPNVEPGGANMSDVLFLRALYQQGAAEWFDVLAAQPYDFEQPSDAPADPGQLDWNRVALLRDVMEDYGDEETAVWAVSFGMGAMDPEGVGGLVEQARENWPWLGPMLWAAWLPSDAHGEYALIDAEGDPGPVLGTLRTLATAPALAWPGVYPADHSSGRYEGDWRVTPWGADIGDSGDRLWIAFRGTHLDLLVRRGAYRAFLFASVDGLPANALPRDDNGRAYIVLYDPLQEMGTVNLARDLPDGEHVAEIVAERGWGQWAIAGWRVSRAPGEGSPWLPVTLGLVAAAILGVTISVCWPYHSQLIGACDVLARRYRALDYRLVLCITGGVTVLVYSVVGTIPSLVALGLLANLLLLRPETGLPLIAMALPFYQLGKPLLGKLFSMVEILTLLTAMAWLVHWLFNVGDSASGDADGLPGGQAHRLGSGTPQGRGSSQRTTRFGFRVSRFTSLDWGIVALVLIGALSLLWAEHGREAAREFRTVVLEAGIFYWLLRAMMRSQRNIWQVTDAWMLGAVAIALVGVCQWAFGKNLVTAEGVWRVRGFYGSPNNLALYLGRAFPVGMAVGVLSTPSLPKSEKEEGRWRRWAYGLAALAMAAGLVLTYSRGAWLLGVPASLLFLAATRGRRTFAAALAVLVAVAIVGILLVGTGRLIALLNTTEGTTFFRLQLWRSSWAMVRDHPLLGVGLDNFLYFYRSYYVLPTAWEEFNLSHPHNLILDFWLRLGLPGLVVLAWLLIAFFRQAWRVSRCLQPVGGKERLLVLGLMAGMVDFVAHGLVDNAFFLVDLGFAFMLMLALAQGTTWPMTGDRSPVSDCECV